VLSLLGCTGWIAEHKDARVRSYPAAALQAQLWITMPWLWSYNIILWSLTFWSIIYRSLNLFINIYLLCCAQEKTKPAAGKAAAAGSAPAAAASVTKPNAAGAAAGYSPAEVAKAWQQCTAPDGRPYIHNKLTKHSKWVMPEEMEAAQAAAAAAAAGYSPAEVAKAWQQCRAPDGLPYFRNHLTQQSKWVMPEEMEAAQAAAAAGDGAPAAAAAAAAAGGGSAKRPPTQVVPLSANGVDAAKVSSWVSCHSAGAAKPLRGFSGQTSCVAPAVCLGHPQGLVEGATIEPSWRGPE